MLVLSVLRNEPIVIRDNAKTTVADVCGTNTRPGITVLLPKGRKEKVLAVRQQLVEGKYDISERLDAILDRILKDLSN